MDARDNQTPCRAPRPQGNRWTKCRCFASAPYPARIRKVGFAGDYVQSFLEVSTSEWLIAQASLLNGGDTTQGKQASAPKEF